MNWKNPAGKLRDSSCRPALLKLEALGLIQLPGAKPVGFGGTSSAKATEVVPEWTKLKSELSKVSGIKLVLVNGKKKLSEIWRVMMNTHHPLGDGPLCGARLRYLIDSDHGYLGALSFSSPARRLSARDLYIGWTEATREARLPLIVMNSRFLILPTVNVPCLASHVLSVATKQLANDWEKHYGVRPVLVETFVDKDYKGTCYLAANWKNVGVTSGRGRQDKDRSAKLNHKQILLYPLQKNWRKILTAPLKFPRIVPSARIAKPVDWAEEEFGECRLNKALTSRLVTIARNFYGHPMANIPEASDGDATKMQAMYRFFAHEDATFETILQPHYAATERRISEMSSGVVLVPQDTTSLNFTNLRKAEGFGPIGTTKDGAQGLHLHSSLAMTAEGVPLGFLDALCWARDPEEFGKKAKRHKLPIEEKESYRWLSNYQAIAAVQARNPQVTLVSVGDREADIYELIAEAIKDPKGPKLLVRAKHNRELEDEQKLLIETIEGMAIAGEYEVHLPTQKNRKKRDAKLSIRYGAVTLCPPKGKSNLPNIPVWAVLAREENAPKDAEPIDWLVITTIKVETLDEAIEKLQWYARRWTIEVFHRTLKGGCGIEERQLQDAARIEACLAIDMVIAWRICYLVKLGREVPDLPCTVYFDDYEWKALVVNNTKNPVPPETPPTLENAMRMVGKLGGFLGRKLDGQPGAECLWRGFNTLAALTGLWTVMNHGP
jgi:hypothetical protein